MPEAAPLSPELVRRVTLLARSMVAAARTWTLYPQEHPAVRGALDRLEEASNPLAAGKSVQLQVTPDTLMIAGTPVPGNEAAIRELAGILHRHLIGALTINPSADRETWRALLTLLSRPADQVRDEGGIAHLWTNSGNTGADVRQLDYAHVLRDSGQATTVEAIIAAALGGAELQLDEDTLNALLALIRDPEKLDELMAGLDEASSEDSEGRAVAIMGLLRVIVTEAQELGAEALEKTLNELAKITARLSSNEMLHLIGERAKRTRDGDIAGAVLSRMDDDAIAQFISASMAKEPDATGRLAHAFQALVPDDDRRRQVLGLAEDQATGSGLANEASFEELRERVQSMVSTYSDASYVSDDYAQELFKAQTKATEIERTHDDPPERIGGWLATVNDNSLRLLDQQLLLDLLTVEQEASRWRDVAETASQHAEDLARSGHFDNGLELVGRMLETSEVAEDRRASVRPFIERLARGPLLKDAAGFLRTADDAAARCFERLCHAVGTTVVPHLSETLALEKDARARRRLRDALVSFGPQGREAVQKLMHSANWEVRRTAAFLLREFGGAEGLRELLPLLADAEPLVQREAVQALVANGTSDAAAIFLQALDGANDAARQKLGKELTGSRDAKAASLLCQVVARMDQRRHEDLYVSILEALGPLKDDRAIQPLEAALHAGEWWAPGRAKRLRAVAAASLRRIGSQKAVEVLKSAAASGGRGTRAAALAELSQLG